MTELLNGRGAWSGDGVDNLPDNPPVPWTWRSNQGPTGVGAYPERSQHHKAVHHGVVAASLRLLEFGLPALYDEDDVFAYGPNIRKMVIAFQDHSWVRGWNLKRDGALGPQTSKCLWIDLVRWYAAYRPSPVPPGHVWGMMGVESNYDPAAVSSFYKPENGPDYGLCQINIVQNSQVTYEQAFKPHYAIDFTCDRLELARKKYAGKGTDLQNKCSIAQHNSPALADRWFDQGFPPPPTPERPQDIGLYVFRVEERAKGFI